MARQLYLIRHAETAKAERGEADLDRKLTNKGITDSLKLSEVLSAQVFPPLVIIHSHAQRTTHTAQLLSATNSSIQLFVEPLIYHASPNDLLQIIQKWSDHWSTVAMIGHNPSISMLANKLSTKMVGNFSPSTVASISFNVNRWADVTSQVSGMLTLFKEPTIL